VANDLLFGGEPVLASPVRLVFGADIRSPTDLVFAGSPVTRLPVRLVFGDDAGSSSQPDATVVLEAVLPGLSGAQAIVLGLALSVRSLLPGLICSAAVQYQSQTQRPTVDSVQTLAQVAASIEAGITVSEQHALRVETGLQAAFTEALLISIPVGIAFGEAQRTATRRCGSFEEGRLIGSRLQAHWQDGLSDRRPQHVSGFTEADRVQSRVLRPRFQEGLPDRRNWLGARFEDAEQCAGSRYRGHAAAGVKRSKAWIGRFEEAWVPRPGIHVAALPPIAPTPYWGAQLLFACPPIAAPLLVFGLRQCEITPAGVVTVPVRRVYFVINDVSLHRVSDGAQVPVFSLSLSLDAASWAWGFEASLPASAEALLDPGTGAGPVALLAIVNGADFYVLAESISRERSFGDASIKVTGRGRNAVLAAPYAPVMSFSNAEARTARQLMDDVLTVNGITLGWSVDWGLTDWNVPAGVFAQQGTWIEALTAIAGAAGGYLIPHRTERSMRVRHRYPVAPWDWDTVTPDFILPVDAVARESLRWLEKPPYNRVFVSGQELGVLGQVTRAGTAGDVLAPMVVDSLITEAAAARQRGIAVLSDTGRQIEVSLRLPVLSETGIIEPGAFVEYQDGSVTRLGLVRATQVQAGLIEVWQTLGVQAYA
jgi:hypothetical protein